MDEKIKSLLGEELAKQVSEKLGETKIIIDDGMMIPKARFDEVNNQAKTFKEQLATQKTEFETQLNSVNAELKTLTEKANLTDEEKKRLADLQANNEKMKTDYEAKLVDQDKHHRIDLALIEAGARNIKSVKANLDVSKVSIDNGNLIGLSEQLEALKKDQDFLFGATKKVGETPPDGGNPTLKSDLEKKYQDAVKTHGHYSAEAIQAKNALFENNKN